ncbi:hypothetical protein ABW19_dt0200377 [Dactylella cylindrospora]|nr:hypothetical protein ABW19_dt0200377 [Dactylella cylindrospora]
MRPDVVVLCFDIGNQDTFREISEIDRKLPTIYGADLPTVVLGLKRDLRHGKPKEEFIDPMIGYKAAQALEVTGYMECSAVTEELIPAVVEDLVKKGLDVKMGDVHGGNAVNGMGSCHVM